MRVAVHTALHKAAALLCLLLLVVGAPGVLAACTGSGHCVPERASTEHACCKHRAAVPMSCCKQSGAASCKMQKQCCGSVQPGVRTEAVRGAQLAAIAVLMSPQPLVVADADRLLSPAPSPPPKAVFELKSDLRI
jgi:hypothetical protein